MMAQRTGLEPATSAVTGRHSNQLNYRCIQSKEVEIIKPIYDFIKWWSL